MENKLEIMLKELKIESFALIDNILVEFDSGLNVLTGETGAGKSLLLDSIGLLCGNRANSDFIRKGSEKALVEGVFELDTEVKDKLNKLDYLHISDDTLVMSREITTNGSNKCKINYKTVPLNIYQEFGSNLFEIHGQNQEQSIMKKEKQLELLDKYISKDEKVKDLLDEIKIKYLNMYKLKSEFDEINQQENKKNDLYDYYQYAVKEISAAELKVDEDLQLKEERNRIANSEKLYKLSATVHQEVHGKLLDSLNTVIFSMQEMEKLDTSMEPLLARTEYILFEFEDIYKEFRMYSQNLEYDEEKLNEIEIRLNEISKLKLKYGKNINDINSKLLEMKDLINKYEDKNSYLDQLQEKINLYQDEYFKLSKRIFEIRVKGKEEIENSIKDKLGRLNIYKDGFRIKIDRLDKSTINGSVEVEFLFSANKGENLMPLRKIASGGEVSRVMLAFKELFAELDYISTLIFDEIDAGIGGETLLKIAEALNLISLNKQVICVTHSPIIAAFADKINSVRKVESDGRILVNIYPLLKEVEIIDELSRMQGGSDNFITAREQSIEMLKFANNSKKV